MLGYQFYPSDRSTGFHALSFSSESTNVEVESTHGCAVLLQPVAGHGEARKEGREGWEDTLWSWWMIPANTRGLIWALETSSARQFGLKHLLESASLRVGLA